ncbi:MAG TPA: efflux RND transporter periplasmic adaptor subunit [Propionicimonas sp.]|nr:efflux RND transporter periplasmic adaptor subunit [Propionicimonas sp.]HQA78383.1 efflux RND transporter periplasmic adaptor subunit [Propionicimonas sp.]HQD97465.1 efflux RND transporter periplasmic adaptor subunit [Propionicimonas sp.]
MNRKTLVTTGIAAAAVLALGAGYAYSVTNSRPEVETAIAEHAELTATVSASGTLAPAHTAGVYPSAAATIAKVTVADGDTVEKGEVLATLATGPLKLAVAQARAAASAAEAQLDAVNRGVPAAIDRSAANAALSAARSQVSTAAKNYSAYLADYRDASNAERAKMRPTLRSLKTAKSTANAALKGAESGLHQLSVAARVGLARTAANDARKAADRALDLAQANLDHAELTAPFAGVVSFVGTVEKGAGATPGVPVFRLVDPTRLEFQAMVNETDIAGITTDQDATVSLDAFDQPFTGKVTRVHSQSETTSTGTVAFRVDVAIESSDSGALSGMSGSVELATESIPDALVVPVAAVQTRGTGRTVFVVDADSVAHAREVEVGLSTDTSVQIISGLSEGDRVVTTGAAALSDGQQVRTK